MENILAINEAAVEEIKEEKDRCRASAMKSLEDLQKLLNGSNDNHSEEKIATAVLESAAQV